MGRRMVVRQSDFGFGELSPEYAASNVEAKTKSLKRGTNCRILNSYGIAQRYGSRFVADAGTQSIVIEIITSAGEVLLGVVRAAGCDIYDEDGVLVQAVSGAPWSSSETAELTWSSREDTVYFTHQSYWPRVLSLVGGVWSFALFAFDNGAGGSTLQPYYRFARAGITLTPSAYTGTIDVEFDDDVLVAGHVGKRFRYGASAASLKEIEIVTVVDGQHGTATVIDDLPPTYDVIVDDASGFRVGEDVQGLDSSATGVVTAINTGSDTVTVLMSSGYESFLSAASSEEYLVGPNTRSKITTAGVTPAAAPAASTVWDEAVFSEVRGYPGDVFERSGRLGFADFPGIPGALILSAPGARNNFDIGRGEAQDAVFWLLAEGGQRILYCVSSSSLIILTDRRAYYVPEDENTPLAANTFQPIEVAPVGSSSAFPVKVEEGIVYVEAGGNRVMGMLRTGSLAAPFEITDLTRHASHLIKNPISLAQTNGNAQAPERYIFALNDDGTLTCMFFDTNPPRLGLTPWQTDGEWLSMVSIQGIIYAVCRRDMGGVSYLLERLDADAQMDASSLFVSNGSLVGDGDEAITLDDGLLLTDAAAVPQLAGQDVKVIRGTEYLGQFTVGETGEIVGLYASDGAFEAGFHFEIDAVMWPPEAEGDQRAMFLTRRISHVAVRVQDSCVWTVRLLGRTSVITRPAYEQGDDLEAAPPQRSEVKRYALAGYEHEPSIQIGRPLPQPLTIVSVAQEVVIT